MGDPFGEDLDGALGTVSDELERLRDLGDAVGNTLTKALRGAIAEGRSLKGLLADIGAAFSQIALKAALAPVGDLVSSAVGNVFAGFNPALPGAAAVRDGGLAASRYIASAAQWETRAAPTRIAAGAENTGPARGAASAEAGVNVTFNVTARDAQSFKSAETEVSAMLLRAVRRGTRGT